MGVNTGFAKCFILFMAIVILLQGCVYLGLSIWGITQETCSHQELNITSNPFKSIVDLIYFMSESCETSPTIILPEVGNTEINVNWAKSFLITNRMYIFMITYAVISGLWVVASLLVIATICGPVTKVISAVIFWPWFLIVIAGSILDAVATAYHAIDIVHTTSAETTFEYIGVSKLDNKYMTLLGTYDAYFITPAVVMVCISSRVVIIWLLNIFGTGFCLSLSRVLAKQRKHHKHHKHDHHHHHHQQQQQPRPISTTTSTVTPVITYSGAQASANPNAAPYAQRNDAQTVEYVTLQHRPAPLAIAPAQQNQTQRQLSSSRNQAQSPNSPNAPALTPDVVILDNANRQSAMNNNNNNNNANNNNLSPAIDETTYRKTDSHPDRLDYPPKTPTSPNQTPMNFNNSNTTAQLSSASMLNNRYSAADGFYTPSGANQAPQRVSDELRSQLPWSYTSMLGGKPQPPRKPQVQVYPQIPEPDYNEESGGNQRASANPTGTGVINDINQSQQAYSRW